METTPVNWESLDSLVIDFARSENLIEDNDSNNAAPNSVSSGSASSPPVSQPSLLQSPSSPSVSSSSYHSRLVIRQIRRWIELGDIDSATDLLRSHAPYLLDDHRILFRLQKQKFIELLRRGTEEARDSAIVCIRKVLAPCALDAYPEAYEEFKHVLLAFIYDKDDKNSPVAVEVVGGFSFESRGRIQWSERRRFEIAGLMSSVLRAHLHAYDPVFSMTLRYLISIHKNFCFRQGMSSPISDLTERLLLEERDPPAVPQESLCEVPPFDEVDIQALAHAVELTRQGAIDSLRFVKGDLFQAFQNELCRMKVDISMLDELVREYCVYRGIVDSGLPFSSGMQEDSELLKVGHPDAGCLLSINCPLEGDRTTSSGCASGSPESSVDVCSTQRADFELRYNNESTGNVEDCSTSGSHQPANGKSLLRARSYMAVDRSKRRRWRGRQENEDYGSGFSLAAYNKHDSSNTNANTNISPEKKGLEKDSMSELTTVENKYEILLGVKELTSRGMAAEVVEEINSLDPNFFTQNSSLLFQLKQIEFLKLVQSGDHSGALRVACSHLGPLATTDPELLKPLKETLLELLRPDGAAVGKGMPLHTLATSVQVAVGRNLGIEEPQLMKIMRATLYTHNEWFKLQMCKDRFESLLRIDSLKEIHCPLLSSSSSISKSIADSSTQGSSQVTVSSSARGLEDGASPNQLSSRDVICDENAILKVMEFLALPRADAIHLLAQYNGNPETVIQQIFA